MKRKEKRVRKEPKFRKYATIGIGLFLISIMILSVLQGNDSEEKVEYHGYKFTKVDEGWVTYKNNNQIFILSSPDDLEDIQIDDVYFGTVKKIYISYKDYVPINLNLIPFPIQPIAASYDEGVSTRDNVPLKDCSDADQNTMVIIIQEGVPISRLDQNCLIMQGDKNELNRIVDKIILNLHGI